MSGRDRTAGAWHPPTSRKLVGWKALTLGREAPELAVRASIMGKGTR